MTKLMIVLCFVLATSVGSLASGFRYVRDVNPLVAPPTVEETLSNDITEYAPAVENDVKIAYQYSYENYNQAYTETMLRVNETLTKFLEQYLSDGTKPGPFEFFALIPTFTKPARCLQKFVLSIPRLFDGVARSIVEVISHLMAGANVGYECVKTHGIVAWDSVKCVYKVGTLAAGGSFKAQLKIIYDTLVVLAYYIIRPGWFLDCPNELPGV